MEHREARVDYWDNAKGLLIFLVVLGHYYAAGYVYSGLSGGKWALPQAVVGFLYMFHMPLFAFISGYFSKHIERACRKAASQLLLPYLLFNTVCILLDYGLLGGQLRNPMFYPHGHMWYLIALFLWRYTAKVMEKLRLRWLWALGFSLLCSALTPGKDWWLLANCIQCLPFFLLGLETGPERIEALRRLPKWLCAAVLALAFAGALAAIGRFRLTSLQLGFFVEYISLDAAGLRQLAVILLRYVLALVLGACVLNLVPGGPCFLSKIGRNTMTVLLLHNLPGIRELLYKLCPMRSSLAVSMLWWTAWAVAATAVFGTDRAAKLYQRGMDRVRRLLAGENAPAG